MPRIDDHRKAAGENLEIFHLKPPFSFFDFIEDRFGDYDSIRRIFSLARSSLAKTLILEVFHSKLKDCFTVNKMGLIKLALKWH